MGWLRGRSVGRGRRRPRPRATSSGCDACRLRFGWTEPTADARPGGKPLARADSFADDELERGTTLGRYLILDRLGAGGMGVVYAAFDPQLDRKVALKVLRSDLGSDQARFAARMLREAKAMARLAHPNVIAVHDVGIDRGARLPRHGARRGGHAQGVAAAEAAAGARS